MLAIQNGTIFTVTGGIIEKGTVLIDGGKITAVGSSITVPEGAKVIDASGLWVTPGLIDAHTHISVKGEPAWLPSVSDITEITSPVTPGVRAIDALNTADRAFPVVRAAGFTTVCALPGSGNLIGGQSVVFKTKPGATVFDIVVEHPVQMKFALGENPRRIHGGEQKKAPLTRLGNAAMIREILYKAREYSDKLLAAGTDLSKKPGFDMQLLALVPVVRGEMKSRIHCHRADDIVTAHRLAVEFGLDFSIEHATEGWKILDYLAEHKITCVVGPLDMAPDKLETWNTRYETPGLMEKAGVNFCLSQDSRSGTRFLPMHIGMAIARGLSFETALKAVTINPARLLGIDKKTGSIEAGKDADLALFDGNPFSSLTLCKTTIIDGKPYHGETKELGEDKP
jgi:imidazolonepropionase-like amidohydrolase